MYIFWSLLGVKKSLSHAQIGLLQGFNSKFPMSIPTPLICGVPPRKDLNNQLPAISCTLISSIPSKNFIGHSIFNPPPPPMREGIFQQGLNRICWNLEFGLDFSLHWSCSLTCENARSSNQSAPSLIFFRGEGATVHRLGSC